MTRILVTGALYLCDGCGAEAEGNTARLPKGWKEWERKLDAADLYLGHLCPKCQPPEAKPPLQQGQLK